MDEFIAFMERYLQLVEEATPDLTEEESAAINEFIREAMEFIQAGGADVAPTPPPVPEPLPAGDFPSSNVNVFRYNPETKEMEVQFHGPYPKAEGPIYSYQGVPPYVFEIIKKGSFAPRTSGKNQYHEWRRGKLPSLGATVYALLIEGGFPYQRVA